MITAAKALIDETIDRRGFMNLMTAAGMSAAGASALATALGSEPVNAQEILPPNRAPAGQGRTVVDVTGGELHAEFLLAWDRPFLFGLAGSEEVGLLDALVDRPDLHYITALHESVALAMADGYSRVTGKTPCVQLHSIAGASYALGQLVNSYRDRVPLVVTVGRQASTFRGSDGFLEAPNLHELPRDYAQWVWDVTSPATIADTLRRAFLLAEAPPGGPTFVTFSKDYWEGEVSEARIMPPQRSRIDYAVRPEPRQVKAIADALLAARRPAMWIGNEAIRFDPSGAVAEIAELTGALVLSANKTPVIFPNTHPHYGGQLGDEAALDGELDLVWSLGAHMFLVIAPEEAPRLASDPTIIHTTLNERELARNNPVDIATLADPKSTAEAVLEELRQRAAIDRSETARWALGHTAARRTRIAAEREAKWSQRPISLPRLVGELDRVIGDDAHIFTELVSSDNYPRAHLNFDHTRPAAQRRRNFDTTGGVLGWSVPAAIGGKIGAPDRETWCLCADGSFNFSSQALWSITRHDVPIAIVLFNNTQYQSNRRAYNRYNRRARATGRYPGVQISHPDIDYVAMASSYGIRGERIDKPGDLRAALGRARQAIVARGKPYLVDVRIERFFDGSESEWFDSYSVVRNAAGGA